jgi:hypothetical protein
VQEQSQLAAAQSGAGDAPGAPTAAEAAAADSLQLQQQQQQQQQQEEEEAAAKAAAAAAQEARLAQALEEWEDDWDDEMCSEEGLCGEGGGGGCLHRPGRRPMPK